MLYTLRGLNFVGIKFCGLLHPQTINTFRGFNFADGPFRNILRISRIQYVDLSKFFSQFRGSILETGG